MLTFLTKVTIESRAFFIPWFPQARNVARLIRFRSPTVKIGMEV